jgi:glycosyltransferase involved in cell wall biosynthesis
VEKTGISNKVLVIIPCYNEAVNIPALQRDLLNTNIAGCTIFPLFINDASTDRTLEVLRLTGASFLDNPVNLGIGGTVQAGFIYAQENGFDYAVQMDGDGQHPPTELIKLLEPLIAGVADVAIGSRFLENTGYRSTLFRRVGIKSFLWLNKMLVGINIQDTTSGYRAFNRKAIGHLVHYYPDEYPEPEAIVYLVHKKMRLLEVPVIMIERQGGISSIRTFSSLYYMAKVTLNILFLHFRMKNE